MATSIAGLRNGIANNLATIDGLRVSAEITDSPNPPVAVVSLNTIDYDQAFQRGLTLYNFNVTVIVGRQAEREAQRRIDVYAQNDGVKNAIESDKSLGGNAYDVRVVGLTSIGSLQLNDQTYLAAEFEVVVYAE